MHSAIRALGCVSVFGTMLAAAVLGGCSSDEGKPSGVPSTTTQAGEGADGGAAGEKKKNAELGCTKNEECESNVCFVGGNQAFCTVKCTAADVATVCTPPFTGSCNKQGYCKRD